MQLTICRADIVQRFAGAFLSANASKEHVRIVQPVQRKVLAYTYFGVHGTLWLQIIKKILGKFVIYTFGFSI